MLLERQRLERGLHECLVPDHGVLQIEQPKKKITLTSQYFSPSFKFRFEFKGIGGTPEDAGLSGLYIAWLPAQLHKYFADDEDDSSTCPHQA